MLHKLCLHTIVLTMLLLPCGRSAAQSAAPECYTDGTTSPYAPVSSASGSRLPCVPSRAPSSDFSRFYGHQENYMPVNSMIGPMYVHKTIKVQFHVMLPKVPGGTKVNYEDNPTDRATLQTIVNKMNAWLGNVPLPSDPKSIVCGSCHITDSRFRVEPVKKADGSYDIRYHSDGLAWENIYFRGSAGPGVYNGSLNAYLVDPEGVLNIFLLYSSRTSGVVAGGISLGAPEWLENIFVGDNSTIPFIATNSYYHATDLDYLANNLLHEIGHTMATHHTFSTETCDETRWDYLSDIYGTTATGSKECPLHEGAENVFMNYNPRGNYMSPLQIARWHLNAHFLGCRRYVYNTYPEDASHDHTGQGQNYPLNISKNETWDFDIKLYTDIVVRSGSKLSIRCRVLMPYHSNIIVEPGAELEIDGGTISSHHDSAMWFGISVYGNADKSQDRDADQGLLTMKNGATISNAVRAVTIGDPVHDIPGRNGGIVRITDAHFINNRGGFQWNPYRNLAWEYEAGAWTRTRLQPNRGYISRSTFTVDDRISRDPVGQVAFAGVDGVALSGCTFTSTMPYEPKGQRCLSGCPDHKAIASWNSSFLFDEWRPVPGSASPIPGSCSGFRQGILAASFSATNRFVVRNSVFENNQIGIATRGVNSFTINDNKFLISNPATPGAAVLGLQLNSSSLYRVYGNQFGPVGSGTDVRIGAEVSEGGSDFNRIYNNSYTRLSIGNLSNFQNSNGFYDPLEPEWKSTGLEFTCNTHTNNDKSIYVQGYLDAAGRAVDGIRRVQGSNDVPAGNGFRAGYRDVYAQELFNFTTKSYDYFTLPVDKYYYYDSDPDQNPRVSTNVSKFPTPSRNQCLPEVPFSGHTAMPGSPEEAAEARIRLSDAYDDYSEGRFGRLDAALLAMGSPYAETERALLYMEAGRVAEGLGIYSAIAQLPLTGREQNDFAQGATLMSLLANRYSQSPVPRWDSLGADEANSLRSVRDNSQMWAQQRACAWLAYAAGEPCAIVLPVLPDAGADGSSMGRTGAGEAAGGDALSIQPNPSARDFELRYSAAQPMELSVSDALGRSLYSAQLPAAAAASYRIPAAAWASGVYLYRITGAGKTLYYGKLLKQ